MSQDYSTIIYEPNFDFWARPVTFYPLGGGPSFVNRGIFSTRSIDIISQDGSDISEQQTILDIREREFTAIPQQQSQVYIPADGAVPDEGWWEVNDVSTNGGGETTLILRRWVPPKP